MQLSGDLPLRALMASPAQRELTAEQESAVARRGVPLLVSAGAGSGKTSVLVERFVRTVCEDGVAPARILAITFTDRAAGELRERVRARLLSLSRREAARDTEAAFVCTFHAFCTRLLRSHVLLAGLDPAFQILDEALAADLREQAFARALADFFAGEGQDGVEIVAAYGADRVRAMLGRTFAELRSRGVRHPRLPAAGAGDGAPRDHGEGGPDGGAGAASDADAAARRACALLDALLGRFGARYEELKRERACVDFDDLELEALQLLEGQQRVREAWAQRFAAVMVDEFQDTNPRQLRILDAIARDNLFTVGDEQQSIYGFRDADVRLFRRRREELEPAGASLLLSRNFRSCPPVLAAVNATFGARLGDRYMPLAAEGGGNGAAPPGGVAPTVELLLSDRNGWNGVRDTGEAQSPYASAEVARWRRAEAHALAARVDELIRDGEAKPGEVAVLLRALSDIEVYERALVERGLHTLASAGGFWRRQEVIDLVAYLRALANPLDELSLYGALAGPLAALSSDALALIAGAAAARAEPAWNVLSRGDAFELTARLDAFEQERLAAFCERLARERAHATRLGISSLIERAVQTPGYQRDLHGGGDLQRRRLANVHKLQRLARRFEAAQGRGLRAFLDHVALQQRSASGGEADAPVAGAAPDAVRLMSVHAAKGLEFDVVCVADLGRAPNLSVSDLLVEEDRVGLRLARLDGSQPQPALAYEHLSEQRKREQAEEEDRILYVAMTRARKRLLLSGAVSFERWPEPRLGEPPIAWLAPALVPELRELVRASGARGGQRELECDGPAGRLRCRLNGAAARGEAPVRDGAPARDRTPAQGDAPPRAGTPAPDGAPARESAPAREGASARDSARASNGGNAAKAAAAREAEPAAVEREGFARIESLSYTALTEQRRCGYRFYLERVLGLEGVVRSGEGARGALDARARGSIVHKLLEAIDFRRPVAPSAAQAGAAAAQLGFSAAPQERRELAALAGVVTDQVQAALGANAAPSARADAPAAAGDSPRPLGARLAAATRAQREYPFAFALGADQPLLSGVIDVLAREPDGGDLVVDYKTDQVGELDSPARLAAREYDLQRLIYALAVLRSGAPRVEVAHWFLERPRELVSVVYHARERGRLEGLLSEQLRAARRRGFSVSERPHRALCETCPGRALLCSWSDSETMREAPTEAASEQLELCAERPD